MKALLLPLVAMILVRATLHGETPMPLFMPDAVGPRLLRVDGGPRFVSRVRNDIFADTNSIIMVALFPANPSHLTIDSGDELLAIDGEFVDGMPFRRYLELFYGAPKDTVIHLDLRSLDGSRRVMTVRVLRPGKVGKHVYGFMKPKPPAEPTP